MTSCEMLMLFCYDVAGNKARRRVAAVLETAAVRVQRSVFEAPMRQSEAERLAKRAARHLERGDSLRVYAISAHGRRRCRVWGPLPLPEETGYYLL